MSEPRIELPEWYPDWLPAAPRGGSPRDQSTPERGEDGDQQQPRHQNELRAGPSQLLGPPSSPGLLPVDSRTDRSLTSQAGASSDRGGFTRAPPKQILVTPSEDRTVKRRLRGIHLFMITLNATLGTGLYWRGGQILELGGPLAVLLAFLLVGILAWAVMQCITEMLCIWPIPGALSVYVSEFVDAELGIVVGIAYWFTYSVSFAALVATSAALFDYWPALRDNKRVDGGVIYFAIPLVLTMVNGLGIEIYGVIEVITGTIKILFLAVIMVFMIAINVGAGPAPREHRGDSYWSSPTVFDTGAAQNWVTALFMSISIATFAFVGVEIVAASALEARWPGSRSEDRIDSGLSRRSDKPLIGSSVKFSAIFLSVLATIAYTISGVLVSLDIPRDDPSLPRLSWVTTTVEPGKDDGSGAPPSITTSAFVVIALQSQIPHLADIFNAFLIFTALTCAQTNLYVASRTLFGLTSRLDGGTGQPWLLRVLAWFGRTNRHKVPMRAMIFSSLAFSWVPFLQLKGGTGTDTAIGMFIEILTEMGSVGVLIVWACECLAFIRYYHCIHRHKETLQAEKISQVRRWDLTDYNDYPYRSHAQPLLAYLALTGCIFVLVVANGAALWNGFHDLAFLASYLIVLVFFALWGLLKLIHGAQFAWVDLSNPQHVIKKIKTLHEIRLAAT
ncbi:putative amino acid transporter [Lasiosphaeria miniovina]|uniref:Amino acid transporter n=1 Tax=Lasiosphaeria miniovina TaxID=1954250 RepID=A0AA40BJ86_9PEZI|nr:putative amino acid transporter [Lasiosphaeria miniovina]KAK0735208.1 putative amino acid transporter [Lasiosphaeria miniovina]